MIHITSATSGTKIYIPCNKGKDAGNSYTLTLASEEYGFVANWSVEDTGNTNDYFVCVVDFSDVKDGEYIYNLDNGNGNWANGLMRFGDQKQGVFEYDVTPTYYEYNPETGESQVIGGLHTIDLDVEYTENGDYTIDTPDNYDGIGKVNVSVNVVSGDYKEGYADGYASGYTKGIAESFDIGYASGHTDGYAEGAAQQKAKLVSITVTENGTYTREDGFNTVVVAIDYEETYQRGYAAGYADGYESGHTVGFNEGYASGYAEGFENGKEYQKSLLVSTAITENGLYEREDGFNSVAVNVDIVTPRQEGYESGWTAGYDSGSTDGYAEGLEYGGQTGYTSGYTDGYDTGFDTGFETGFNSGSIEGFASGYSSGHTDGMQDQKNLLVSTTITENGIYTREDGYNEVTVNVPIPVPEPVIPDYAKSGDLYLPIVTSPVGKEDYDFCCVFRCMQNGYIIINDDEDAVDPSSFDGVDKDGNQLTFTYKRDAVVVYGDYIAGNYYPVWFKLPGSEILSRMFWNGEIANTVLPSKLTKINASGFREAGIVSLTSYALTAPTIGRYAISGCRDNGVLRVPSGATGYDAWLTAVSADGTTGWTIEYFEYNEPLVDLETKNISASTEITVITPTSGYDGIEQVTVNAKPYGDTRYEEGYESGYTAGYSSGETHQKSLLTATTITENGTYTREDGWNEVSINVQPALETKSVNAQDINTEITTSDGYYGMSKINVNAERVYDSGILSGWGIGVASAATFNENNIIRYKATDQQFPWSDNDYKSLFTDNNYEIVGSYFDPATQEGYWVFNRPITSLPYHMFDDEWLDNGFRGTELTFPETVTYVDRYALGNKYLRNITFLGEVAPSLEASGDYIISFKSSESILDSLDPALVTLTIPYRADYSNFTDPSKTNHLYENNIRYISGDKPIEIKTVSIPQDYSANTIVFETSSGYAGMGELTVDIGAYGNMREYLGERFGYASGYTEGVADQKEKLVATAITENGTYTREDGWNEVDIDVPQTFVVTCTLAEYNAMVTHREDTIYLIKN